MSENLTNEGTLQPDQRKIAILNQASSFSGRTRPASFPVRLMRRLRRQFLPYYFIRPPMWRIALRARSKKSRMKPGFISLGAVRSGTTLLSDYIMQHPCVVLPLAKEMAIRAAPIQRFVSAQFPTVEEGKSIEQKYGRSTTGFCGPMMPGLYFPYYASAMVEKVKIILIMRNPVERTFSHWRFDNMLMSRVQNDPLWKNYPGFPEIVRDELEAIEHNGSSGFANLSGAGCGSYVQHSIYLPFLKTLFRIFDKEDAMFINSQDFFDDPQGTAKRIYAFLDLPDYEPVEMQVRNAGPVHPFDEETRARLSEFFAPLNQELYNFIGEDFGWE